MAEDSHYINNTEEEESTKLTGKVKKTPDSDLGKPLLGWPQVRRATFRRDPKATSKIESGRETDEDEEQVKRVRKVLRSLNQTRESLSVEESFLEQPGQLLDKALTKQIAIREAELDSLVAPKKKNVSVIVRCSTPDPETKCSKNNPASHFPDPDKVFYYHLYFLSRHAL